MRDQSSNQEQMQRVRTLCRAALALGLVASLAANVVAAEPTVVGRVVAGWPPLVLLIVVELIGRVSLERGALSRLRLVAAGGIAAVAALVSYKHMLEVATLAGEGPVEAHLIPLTVDGLVIVASISLVGLNRRRVYASKLETSASKPKRTEPSPKPPMPARQVPPASEPRLSAVPAVSSSRGGDAGARIAAFLTERPEAKQSEVAEALGVSAKTVQRSAAWKKRLEMAG